MTAANRTKRGRSPKCYKDISLQQCGPCILNPCLENEHFSGLALAKIKLVLDFHPQCNRHML